MPICIAIDICQGSLAPVHLGIPTSSQESIQEFPQFQKYIEKGWKFGFYEALVSSSGITYDTSILNDYWSGSANFIPNVPTFDLRLETSLNAQLSTTPNLWLNFSFMGDLYHQSSPSDQEVMCGSMHVVCAWHALLCASIYIISLNVIDVQCIQLVKK